MHVGSKTYCACGCGEKISNFRVYVQGHNRRGFIHNNKSRKKMSKSHKGKLLKESHKRNIGLAHIGKPKWNRGKTYVEIYGKEKADKIKEKISNSNSGKIHSEAARKKHSEARIRYLRTCKNPKLVNTKIEILLKNELKRIGIPYRSQVKIDSFVVDIKIIGVPLVIECDGDYWHGPSNPRTQQKDLIRNKKVPKVINGILLIFLGSEIIKNTKRCGKIVKRVYNELRS